MPAGPRNGGEGGTKPSKRRRIFACCGKCAKMCKKPYRDIKPSEVGKFVVIPISPSGSRRGSDKAHKEALSNPVFPSSSNAYISPPGMDSSDIMAYLISQDANTQDENEPPIRGGGHGHHQRRVKMRRPRRPRRAASAAKYGGTMTAYDVVDAIVTEDLSDFDEDEELDDYCETEPLLLHNRRRTTADVHKPDTAYKRISQASGLSVYYSANDGEGDSSHPSSRRSTKTSLRDFIPPPSRKSTGGSSSLTAQASLDMILALDEQYVSAEDLLSPSHDHSSLNASESQLNLAEDDLFAPPKEQPRQHLDSYTFAGDSMTSLVQRSNASVDSNNNIPLHIGNFFADPAKTPEFLKTKSEFDINEMFRKYREQRLGDISINSSRTGTESSQDPLIIDNRTRARALTFDPSASLQSAITHDDSTLSLQVDVTGDTLRWKKENLHDFSDQFERRKSLEGSTMKPKRRRGVWKRLTHRQRRRPFRSYRYHHKDEEGIRRTLRERWQAKRMAATKFRTDSERTNPGGDRSAAKSQHPMSPLLCCLTPRTA